MKTMLRTLIYPIFALLMLLSGQSSSFAQARLVINNSGGAVYMRMSGGVQATPIYLVLDNAATNAITCGNAGAVCPASGLTSGWIVSEGQYNYIKWRQIAATTHVVPFGGLVATNNYYLPLTFAKTTAGLADLSVSTWPAASNNTPWAGISDAGTAGAVTNMWSANLGQDGSDEAVIDRWWDIYTGGAAATANITFNYSGVENTMQTPDRTGTIAVQHWTGTQWNDGKGGGNGTTTTTGTAGTNAAGAQAVTANGFTQFTPFVLVSLTNPLPVQWLSQSAECNGGDVTIKWSTASEQNSDFFTVERSLDGTNFTPIQNVLAAGNSSTVRNYTAVDSDPYSGVSFYRIRETDFNSSSMVNAPITVNGCSSDDIFIFGNEGGVSVDINALTEGRYNFELYDVLGQRLMNETKTVSEGSNHLKLSVSNIASAMYVVKVYSTSNAVSKKVFIRSAYTQ